MIEDDEHEDDKRSIWSRVNIDIDGKGKQEQKKDGVKCVMMLEEGERKKGTRKGFIEQEWVAWMMMMNMMKELKNRTSKNSIRTFIITIIFQHMVFHTNIAITLIIIL